MSLAIENKPDLPVSMLTCYTLACARYSLILLCYIINMGIRQGFSYLPAAKPAASALPSHHSQKETLLAKGLL